MSVCCVVFGKKKRKRKKDEFKSVNNVKLENLGVIHTLLYCI